MHILLNIIGLAFVAVLVLVPIVRFIRWLVTPPNWHGVDDEDSFAENFFDRLWGGRRGRWW